jgi:hypothetical protein
MKQDSVRTTVDIPAPLYQQLKDRAAASELSVDELLVEGAEKILVENQHAKPYRVKFPLIDSDVLQLT